MSRVVSEHFFPLWILVSVWLSLSTFVRLWRQPLEIIVIYPTFCFDPYSLICLFIAILNYAVEWESMFILFRFINWNEFIPVRSSQSAHWLYDVLGFQTCGAVLEEVCFIIYVLYRCFALFDLIKVKFVINKPIGSQDRFGEGFGGWMQCEMYCCFFCSIL